MGKVIIGIVVGLILGTAVTNWYYKNLSSVVNVGGTIQYQDKVTFDSSPPPPPGYYIQSRVYLQFEVSEWLGKEVSLIGDLSTIGNESGNYPIITEIERFHVKRIRGSLYPLKMSREEMKHRRIGAPQSNKDNK